MLSLIETQTSWLTYPAIVSQLLTVTSPPGLHISLQHSEILSFVTVVPHAEVSVFM